jgi:diadenylate cyclase
MEDKEKKMLDLLKKVSPGSVLRVVIDDLIRSGLGTIIVFDSPKLQECFEGGFRVNCRFTSQRLFELCKMDGAIILSSDMKRILYGNVLLTPDKNIPSNETGTRHKAAERTAKQAETLVIAVSERKKKTTLYHLKNKIYLRQTEEIQRGLTNSLQVLEKQREQFNELLGKINILEISNLVSVGDVCKIFQRCEMIARISDSMKKELIELGRDSNIMGMRFRELIKGVEKEEDEMIRDYSPRSLKRTRALLANLTFESLTEVEVIARLIFEKELNETISPRGFRFLTYLGIPEKETSLIVNELHNLNQILECDEKKLESILKGRTATIKQEIQELRGQILEGKVCF